MSEHPAVAFLLAAHQQAEALARAATPAPWTVDEHDDETITSGSGAVARMRDHVRVMTNAQVEADRDLVIAMAQPVPVLRRVAAEQLLLADLLGEPHASDCWIGTPNPGVCDCGRDERVELRVQLLAGAWGWTAP